MDKDQMEEIAFREKQRSLHINRIPVQLRDNFKQLSEEEFSGDFGFTLKFLFDQAMEYQQMKEALFNGYLNKNSTEVSTASQEEIPESKDLRMCSGKKLNNGGKKHE